MSPTRHQRHRVIQSSVVSMGAALMAPTLAHAQEIPTEAGDTAMRVATQRVLNDLSTSFQEMFGPEKMLAAIGWLVLLYVLVRLAGFLSRYLAASRAPALGERLQRWMPAVKTIATIIGILVVLDAILPEAPSARGSLALVLLLVLGWATRDPLRNAVAGFIFFTRHILRHGTYVRVGHHQGTVVGVTIRGVKIQDADGNQTTVPHAMFHTRPVTAGQDHRAAAPVEMKLPIAKEQGLLDEAHLDRIRRWVHLSPWVAPASTVSVSLRDGQLIIMTRPFSNDVAKAMRVDIARRVGSAMDELTPPSTTASRDD